MARRGAGKLAGRKRRLRSVPQGIRITKVGLWYVLFSVVVAIAATNTGNNALYMVLALMLATLVTSGILSRQNVRAMEIELDRPGEIFAHQPFHLGFSIHSRGFFMPRWFLLVSLAGKAKAVLVPFLRRRGSRRGDLEVIMPRRGLHPLRAVHVTSLFPFGFFRKGVRYPVKREVLVFPSLFPAASTRPESESLDGQRAARRRGRGHDLHALRAFRQGDDPRGIHWKQTARTGGMIFMERQAEDTRRLAILFDNGAGPLSGEGDRERFESLVSEAATAAVDHLGRGWEVELVTRDRGLRFARGRRQRYAILEALAMVEAIAREAGPLASSDPRSAALRIGSIGVEPVPAATTEGVGAAG